MQNWTSLNNVSDSKTIKTQLKSEISHTDRKDHYGSKIYIKQPRCFSWNKVQYNQAVLRQQTNMGEGFTNDPTTHHYGVLHDPATHHTSGGVILHDSNYWATKEFSTQG